MIDNDARVSFRSSPPPSPADEIIQFAKLQHELEDRWSRLRDIDSGPRDVVVIPSLSLDGMEFSSIPGFHFYEERMLFTLSLLRHPRAHLIYVTSQPVHPAAVDYHLSLLSGIPTAHVRERLTLLSAYDSSARPLTNKILERPRLIQRIRDAIRPQQAHMVCFNVTPRERSLAVRLGIPLYGVDPELSHLGTKTGSRRVFRKAGISLAPGSEGLHSETEVAEAVVDLWDSQHDLRRVVIKHDEGFSGEGNAVLELGALADVAPNKASRATRTERVLEHLPNMKFIAAHVTYDSFRRGFERLGGVVETWIEGAIKRSPSAQLRINPRFELEAMSTHDQILGEDGQTYQGCRFPADPAYRLDIQKDALLVGEVLRAEGVVGRIAVDFVTVEKSPGNWERFAIEINLRMSGTTHPLMTMQMLNGGRYDPESGIYRTGRGDIRYYVASDSLTNPTYRGLLVDDMLDIASVHDLHYKPWTDAGVVFHLTGALSEYGKLGLIAIGESPEKAEHWFSETRRVLDRETSALRVVDGVPR